jgi:hypothetical protein
VYEEKKEKYLDLARNLKRLRREEVRITVVIVSSMGAVYDRSLKDLQKMPKFTNREIRKLGKKMSETVLMGSMEIWRQNAHEIRRENDESANMLIEEEVERLEQDAAEREDNARFDLEREEAEAEAEDHRDGDSDDFEPEGGHENSEMELNPGYVQGAEVDAEDVIAEEIEAAPEQGQRVPEPEEGKRENGYGMLGMLGRDAEIGSHVAEVDSEEGQRNPRIQAEFRGRDEEEVGIIIDEADDEGHRGSNDEELGDERANEKNEKNKKKA